MSLNRVILLGRLGRDPEIRTTQSGMVVATLNLATDSRRPDGNNGWKNVTEWHRVVLFGKQGELAQKFLTKGREVLIEGELRTREWQDKQGQKRWTTEVVANNMRFVGGRGGDGGSSGGSGFNGGRQQGTYDDPAPVGSGTDDYGAGDYGGGGEDSDIPF